MLFLPYESYNNARLNFWPYCAGCRLWFFFFFFREDCKIHTLQDSGCQTLFVAAHILKNALTKQKMILQANMKVYLIKVAAFFFGLQYFTWPAVFYLSLLALQEFRRALATQPNLIGFNTHFSRINWPLVLIFVQSKLWKPERTLKNIAVG